MQKWFEIAAAASKDMPAAAHGSTMQDLAQRAARYGTTRQALSNYLTAYRFAVGTGDLEMERLLATFSATVVLVYSRWARRDLPAALDHARRAYAEGWSRSVIEAAELASRSKAEGMESPSLDFSIGLAALDEAFAGRRPAGGSIAEALGRVGLPPLSLAQLSLQKVSLPLATAGGVRRMLVWPDGEERQSFSELTKTLVARGQLPTAPYEIAGLLEIASSSVPQAHRRHARITLARAVMVSSLYPLTLIVLPNVDALAEFEDALPPLPTNRLGVPQPKGTNATILAEGLGTVVWTAAPILGRVWAGL